MSRAVVYLNGAITGDPRTWTWRDEVAHELDYLYDIDTLNPLRGKDLSTIKGNGYTSNIPGNIFVARDLNDIRNSNVMLCNFLIIPERQMIGSLQEMGYAYALGVPFIVVATDPMITEHPFIKYTALEIAESIHDAVETIGIIFNDGRTAYFVGRNSIER